MSSAGGSFSHIGLHVGSDWVVRCSTYDASTPIFSVDAGDTVVSFSVADRNPTEMAVEFARNLAHQAQAFANEVERLHAERTAACTAEPAKRAA